MITDILYLFAGTFLQVIGYLFGLLNFVFPTAQVTASILFFAGYLRPLGAFLDLAAIVSFVSYFMGFLTVWYGYKLILAMVNWLPIPWTHPSHPKV